MYTKQHHRKGVCSVDVTTELLADRPGSTEVAVIFNGEVKKRMVSVGKGTTLTTSTFEVTRPKLWWPVGYGDQVLYDLSVATPDESTSKKIGLRTMEVAVNRTTWVCQWSLW